MASSSARDRSFQAPHGSHIDRSKSDDDVGRTATANPGHVHLKFIAAGPHTSFGPVETCEVEMAVALKCGGEFSPTNRTAVVQLQSVRMRRMCCQVQKFAQSRFQALRVEKAHSGATIGAVQDGIHSESEPNNRPLPPVRALQAVLFDVDGTLVDSDPLHYICFRDMLTEIGYNGGTPITKEFYSSAISGHHGKECGRILFPDWDQQRRDQFMLRKEAYFRSLAVEQLKAVEGLHRLTDWIKKKGFRRAAVTNAPRKSAEQMIAAVGLSDFFEYVVIGGECERAKPFPDPYLKGLEHFGNSAQNAFAVEDSAAGLEAAVAAGVPVVGITTGNPGPALLAAGAAFLIKDYNDPALWKRLEK